MSDHIVTIPNLGVDARFVPRAAMKSGRPRRKYGATPGAAHALPAIPPGPIDWTKGDSLSFPVLGNDRYGDCMYCGAVHLDQTFTGNVGAEQAYDESAVVRSYLQLSPGDRGLDEGTLVDAWKRGLAGNPDASIVDALDIDTTDTELVRSAVYFFGGVLFMLAVPSRWIDEAAPGAVWDVPAVPDPMNGHGTAWNAVDERGRRKTQTWGTHVWITPAGVQHCDPSGFVAFSKRWFDPTTGLAPNGFSYDELASLWVGLGGDPPPANPFRDCLPPA